VPQVGPPPPSKSNPVSVTGVAPHEGNGASPGCERKEARGCAPRSEAGPLLPRTVQRQTGGAFLFSCEVQRQASSESPSAEGEPAGHKPHRAKPSLGTSDIPSDQCYSFGVGFAPLRRGPTGSLCPFPFTAIPHSPAWIRPRGPSSLCPEGPAPSC